MAENHDRCRVGTLLTFSQKLKKLTPNPSNSTRFLQSTFCLIRSRVKYRQMSLTRRMKISLMSNPVVQAAVHYQAVQAAVDHQ